MAVAPRSFTLSQQCYNHQEKKEWQTEIVLDDKSTFNNKIHQEETLKIKINKYKIPLEETLKDKINNNKIPLEETLKDKINNIKSPASTGIKGMQ